MNYADLLLRSGNIARIEYPAEHEDAVLESIDNAIRCGDPIPMRDYPGCSCEINGVQVDRVFPHQVEAML